MAKATRASQAELEAAVDALRDGELVAFPTETVYGLGANAANPAAVRKVFELKGRPPSHPVIVHIDQQKYLKRWVREVTPVAEKLAEAFWPGPLTLVMPRARRRCTTSSPAARTASPSASPPIRWPASCWTLSAAASRRLRPTATVACRPRAPSMCWTNSATP